MTNQSTSNDTKFVDDVLDLLNGTYTADKGKTFFQGQSVSHLLAVMREKGCWKHISGSSAHFEDTLTSFGFEIVRAQCFSNGKRRSYGMIVTV